MQRIQSGAYLAEDFAGGLDPDRWQIVPDMPKLAAEATDQCLRLHGVSTRSTDVSVSVTSRRWYPATVSLVAEMRVPMDLGQPGSFGVGIQLRGIGAPGSPEPPSGSREGSRVVFGKHMGSEGWYQDSPAAPLRTAPSVSVIPPAGDESSVFRTVRVAFSRWQDVVETHVLHGAEWIWVGEARSRRDAMRAALTAKASGVGVAVDVRFRNVRIYAAHDPVRVLVGSGDAMRDSVVVLSSPDGNEALAEARVGSDGAALLMLPEDAVFPMSGTLSVCIRGRALDQRRIEASGVEGIYPGDVYSAMVPLFHI
ncbi:hypothetical protein FJZ36_12680 [Candidatus Poribacteria bacterium]|nr:hypothetical protein [Candidatus Poribacteria bacterium]